MGFFNKSKKKNNKSKSISSTTSSASNLSLTDDIINEGETSPEQVTAESNYINMRATTSTTNQQQEQHEDYNGNGSNNYIAPMVISPTAAPSDEFFASPLRGTSASTATTAYPINSNEQQHQQQQQSDQPVESIPQSPSYEQTVSAATAFVNEQVGKVRQLAEEGPLSFRVLAFLGGVAMIVTSVLDWIGELFGFSMHKFLISLYTFSFGIIICILEGRMFVPETHKYQQKFIIYAKLLKYVWGRGLFYFFAGTLQFSQMRILDMASGSFMIFVGIISLVVGNRTSKKLSKLSQSIAADEDKLYDKFVQYSQPNNHIDDYLEQADFAELVHDIGLSLDNNEHIAAFATIDADDDGKISFDDLKSWWSGFNTKTSHEVSLLV